MAARRSSNPPDVPDVDLLAADERSALLALRDRLALALKDGDTPPGALPTLSKEFRTVRQAIAQMVPAERSKVDELAARRAAAEAAGNTDTGYPQITGRRSQPTRRRGGNRTS